MAMPTVTVPVKPLVVSPVMVGVIAATWADVRLANAFPHRTTLLSAA
jgi:hypothetical protein